MGLVLAFESVLRVICKSPVGPKVTTSRFLFGIGTVLALNMLSVATVNASPAHRATAAAVAHAINTDPSIGPHSRDEARHQNDPITFTPASSTAMGNGARYGMNSQQPLAPTAFNASGLQKEVFGFAPYWALSQHNTWNYSLLSTIAYFGFTVNWDGNFDTASAGSIGFYSQDFADMVTQAHQAGAKVVLVIKGSGTASINDVVTVPSETQLVITNTINAIGAKN